MLKKNSIIQYEKNVHNTLSEKIKQVFKTMTWNSDIRSIQRKKMYRYIPKVYVSLRVSLCMAFFFTILL